MSPQPHRLQRRYQILAAIAAAVIFAGACSSTDSASPEEYFEGFETSQAELDLAVSQLFSSPLVAEVESFEEETPDELTESQEATVKQFIKEFWTGAAAATAVHREQMSELAVPDALESAHGDYVAALEALIDSRDANLARAENTSGVELLATFWEGTTEIELMDATCTALIEEAAARDIVVQSAICAQ